MSQHLQYIRFEWTIRLASEQTSRLSYGRKDVGVMYKLPWEKDVHLVWCSVKISTYVEKERPGN
jgi:hypothetical protein